MGLFSFLRGSGKTVEKEKNAVLTPAVLQKEITDAGLDSSKIEVKVADGKVTLSGEAKNKEELEKAILAVGNVNGIAEVQEDVTIPDADSPASKMHTVVSGDTLSAIAQKYYGNANAYSKIFEANKPMLSHPDKIYPGQVLRIPE